MTQLKTIAKRLDKLVIINPDRSDKPYMDLIVSRMSDAQRSMYWWTLELGHTKKEWFEWYFENK